MMLQDDTICAISTPHGVGGIAVARVSGADAITIVDKIWKGKPLTDAASHTAHLGTIIDEQGDAIDQAVATISLMSVYFGSQPNISLDLPFAA